MADQPSRKRRIVKRLAISLALAAILLCVVDWYLTRDIDQRLVGVWHVTTPKFSDIVWVHSRYGRGAAYRERDGQRLFMVRYAWGAQDGIHTQSSLNSAKDFMGWAAEEWEILRRRNDYVQRFRIVELDRDRALLDDLETDERLMLRRFDD